MSNKKGGVTPPFGYIFVYYLFLQAPGPPVGGTSHLHAESASQDCLSVYVEQLTGGGDVGCGSGVYVEVEVGLGGMRVNVAVGMGGVWVGVKMRVGEGISVAVAV